LFRPFVARQSSDYQLEVLYCLDYFFTGFIFVLPDNLFASLFAEILPVGIFAFSSREVLYSLKTKSQQWAETFLTTEKSS
jgi:hypothetical protein